MIMGLSAGGQAVLIYCAGVSPRSSSRVRGPAVMTTLNVLALFSGAGTGAMIAFLMVAWALDR